MTEPHKKIITATVIFFVILFILNVLVALKRRKIIFKEIEPFFKISDYELNAAKNQKHINCTLNNLNDCNLLYGTFLKIKKDATYRRSLINRKFKSHIYMLRKTIAVRMTINESIDCLEYEKALKLFLTQKKIMSEKDILKIYIQRGYGRLKFKINRKNNGIYIF